MKKYYVYLVLVNDVPRYVGKGSGDRIRHGREYWDFFQPGEAEKRVLAEQSKGSIISRVKLHDNLSTNEEAFNLEIQEIAHYGREDLGKGTLWNLTDGGRGTINLSLKSIEKRNVKLRGQKRSDEACKHNSESHKGIHPSEETRKKLGIVATGRQNNLGKHWSEETNKRNSESNTGRKFSEEHCQHIAQGLIGRKNTWSLKGSKNTWSSKALTGRKHTKEHIQAYIDSRKRNRLLKEIES